MTYPALSDVLRELYVNVAEYDFALAGKDQTDSRVSLLTGIHRKEVRRLRGAGSPVNVVPASLSQTSRILARWMADAAFLDHAGGPMALPRVAPPGMPSFETLVTAVTRDVRPRAILDEWLDRRIVVLDPQGDVTLVETAFVPRDGDDEQLHYFGRNLHDHIAAAVANVGGDAPRFLERSVHYDRLSAATARRLEALSRTLALTALREANRDAHEACDQDGGGHWRWNFGVYVFADEVPDVVDPKAEAAQSARPGP